MQQYIGFKLDGSEYTIPILKVREIINTPSITSLPKSPEYMKGIVNLRGRIVPILDLRELVSMEGADAARAAAPAPGDERGGKVIVLASPANMFGILVDSITSVINIDSSNIEEAHGLMDLESVEGVARLDDRLIILLDTDRLVAPDELDVIGRGLEEIQRAADMKKVASTPQPAPPVAPVAAPVEKAAPAAPAPPAPAKAAPPVAPVAAPVEKAIPAAPQAAPAAPASAGGAGVNRVTVEELHAAKDILSRQFGDDESRAEFLADLITLIDAMAQRDFTLADKLIGDVIQSAEGDLYNQIGHVTRKLHNSLKDFRQSLDPRIRRIADEEVPQAVDSLEYVIKKTEEAANKTLAVVEKHQAGLTEFELRVQNAGLPEDLAKYLDRFRISLLHDLNEVMLAQGFQDMTGQTIRRVIDLVNAIEAELIGLIAHFGVKPEKSKEAAAKPASEKMTQGDIEGLLSEFGF